MKEQMTRREALKYIGGSAVAVATGAAVWHWAHPTIDGDGYDPTWKIDFDGDTKTISYREAKQMARRFNHLWDAVPDNQRQLEINEETFRQWIDEIVPMFAYNEAVNDARVPAEFRFEAFTSGNYHNHVLGESDCKNHVIINARAQNPVSAWYGRPMFLAALVHELAHYQQGETVCRESDRSNVETTAQIVTWEILANMANGGNRVATIALIDELFDVTMGVALLGSRREKQEEDFAAFHREVDPTFFEYAPLDRSMRYWRTQPMRLQEILRDYYEQPLLIVVNAMQSDGGDIEGLALPPYYGGGNVWRPGTPRVFTVDDLTYFLDHAESAVSAL